MAQCYPGRRLSSSSHLAVRNKHSKPAETTFIDVLFLYNDCQLELLQPCSEVFMQEPISLCQIK